MPRAVCYCMTNESEAQDRTVLSPDEAFSTLGNETRIRILQTLGETHGSLSFTDLRERVGIPQGRQFNYHLDKLVGHFVERTDDGYHLLQAGRRVIEAVLSGAVTETPEIEPVRVDLPCFNCGAPVEICFREEMVWMACTECSGDYGESSESDYSVPWDLEERGGLLGGYYLPPSGVRGRTASEVVQTAYTWTVIEELSLASGICPRCSAGVYRSVRVCESHEAIDEICETCGRRYAVWLDTHCTNCVYFLQGPFELHLLAHTDFLAFVISNGINPLSWTPELNRMTSEYDEEVLSTEPFNARFTFEIDDDALTMTVDDDLNVVEVAR